MYTKKKMYNHSYLTTVYIKNKKPKKCTLNVKNKD